MHSTTGQTVVHPQHGAATVHSIITRTVRNVESRYIILEIRDTNLVVGVPAENDESVGVSTVFNRPEIDTLFDVRRAPTEEEESRWFRRMKAAQEKLNSGDIFAVAEVVRNLLRRSVRAYLSPSGQSMLKHLKQPLVTEVSLSLGLEKADAETLLDALPELAAGDSHSSTFPAFGAHKSGLVAV